MIYCSGLFYTQHRITEEKRIFRCTDRNCRNEAPSTILFYVLRSTPLTAAPGLPTNDALLKTIRRERPAIQLDHHGRLPLKLRQTDRDESFILYEDDSMIIFTCDKNLSILKECKHWFMDGTFS
ncbi:unnamed protein product, partial [Rotaria sp. Silwood2]